MAFSLSNQPQYVYSDYWVTGYAEGDGSALLCAELQKAAPSAIIELYQLELNQNQHGIDYTYYFHAGTNLNANGEIVWAGQSYIRLPVEADGFEYQGTGQLPRPKLRISNIAGTVSTILSLLPSGLEGAKFTRIRTLARFLDAANFPPLRNLLLYTQLFDSWTKSNCTIDQAAVMAPDGTMTGNKIKSDVTTNTSRSVYRVTSTLNTSAHTFSVYAKAAERSWLYCRLETSGGSFTTNRNISFNLTTGVVGTITGTATATITDAGNGWWRCTVTATPDASGTARVRFYVGAADNDATFSEVADAGIYIWGAQAEEASAATAYQPIGASFSQNPYGTPEPTATWPEEIYYIDRRATENRDVVEFETCAAFDLAGVYAPKRLCLSSICQWVYRGDECGYTGSSYFDANDNPVANASQDVCGKRLTSCEKRFGTNVELPYGSFPGVGGFQL